MKQSAKLSDKTIRQQLTRVGGWHREKNSITKEFVLNSFTGAVRFVLKIAPIANAMDHHPDVEIYKYKRVKINLTTHDAGGITSKDFSLAARIDRLATRRKSGPA